MRAIQRLNHRLNVDVADEDAELVARVQAGMATTGWTPGPLGEREAAVAWFAVARPRGARGARRETRPRRRPRMRATASSRRPAT